MRCPHLGRRSTSGCAREAAGFADDMKGRFPSRRWRTPYPRRIGNKVLLSLEECDECNSAAAECETDFAAFTLAERTMGQVRGKSGVPSVKSYDRLSRIDMGADGFEI